MAETVCGRRVALSKPAEGAKDIRTGGSNIKTLLPQRAEPRALLEHGGRDLALGDCPGQKPPFSAVKRPARPYRSPI